MFRPPDETALADAESDAQRRAADWLLQLSARLGRHLTDMAHAAGVNQTTLTQGVRGRRPLTAATILKVAEAFRVTPPPSLVAQLAQGRYRRDHRPSAASRRVASHFVLPPMSTAPGRVRVFTTPSELPPPLFRINFADEAETAPLPAGIAEAKGVFVFRMPNSTMAPWRRRDERVYVDQNRDATEGRHALLRLIPKDDENGMEAFAVGKLADYRGPGGAPRFLRYDSPDRPLDLSGWHLVKAMLILELDDLLGP
jgi:transcriptional regulator with XRE-family HTH domain